LYLPERWFSEAYQERRQRCGVPADQQPRTEPELAAELITTLHRRGVLPFQWVTCDEHCGNNPALLDAVAAAGVYYLAEVPHPTRVWWERPPTAVPPRRGGADRPPGSGSGRTPRRRCGWTTWRSSSRRTSGRPP